MQDMRRGTIRDIPSLHAGWYGKEENRTSRDCTPGHTDTSIREIRPDEDLLKCTSSFEKYRYIGQKLHFLSDDFGSDWKRCISFMKGLDDHLKQQRILLLNGPAGAGKSSLANHLAQLYISNGDLRGYGIQLNMTPDLSERTLLGWTDIMGSYRKGPLGTLISKSLDNPKSNFVFLLNEWNRSQDLLSVLANVMEAVLESDGLNAHRPYKRQKLHESVDHSKVPWNLKFIFTGNDMGANVMYNDHALLRNRLVGASPIWKDPVLDQKGEEARDTVEKKSLFDANAYPACRMVDNRLSTLEWSVPNDALLELKNRIKLLRSDPEPPEPAKIVGYIPTILRTLGREIPDYTFPRKLIKMKASSGTIILDLPEQTGAAHESKLKKIIESQISEFRDTQNDVSFPENKWYPFGSGCMRFAFVIEPNLPSDSPSSPSSQLEFSEKLKELEAQSHLTMACESGDAWSINQSLKATGHSKSSIMNALQTVCNPRYSSCFEILLESENAIPLLPSDWKDLVKHACDNGCEDIAKAILTEKWADLVEQPDFFAELLDALVQASFYDIVQEFFLKIPARTEVHSKPLSTLLETCCREGENNLTKHLLEYFGSIFSRDCLFNSLFCAVTSGNLHGVRMLTPVVDQSARGVNSRQTCLHTACKKGFLSITKELLASGANVNARDENERTPLMLASQFGYSAVVFFLLQQDGVSVNAVDRGGKTALLLACSSNECICSPKEASTIIEMLLSSGAVLSAATLKVALEQDPSIDQDLNKIEQRIFEYLDGIGASSTTVHSFIKELKENIVAARGM